MVKMSMEGNNTIIDFTQDTIKQIDIDTDNNTIELIADTKKYSIKLSKTVFFALLNALNEPDNLEPEPKPE